MKSFPKKAKIVNIIVEDKKGKQTTIKGIYNFKKWYTSNYILIEDKVINWFK